VVVILILPLLRLRHIVILSPAPSSHASSGYMCKYPRVLPPMYRPSASQKSVESVGGGTGQSPAAAQLSQRGGGRARTPAAAAAAAAAAQEVKADVLGEWLRRISWLIKMACARGIFSHENPGEDDVYEEEFEADAEAAEQWSASGEAMVAHVI
jgi:hypothetical protein